MRAKRTDANQAEIVKWLLQMGASVQDTSAVGQGFPDLVIGWHGRNVMVEVKTDKGKTNVRQDVFAATWNGQYDVVRTLDDVIAVLNRAVRK